MDTRNDNTTVVNNQASPVNNPQGMRPQQRPGTMPPPSPGMQAKNPADDQTAKRAMLAAAAIILGGAVGVGGAMAANSISDKFDENEADIAKAMQETRDAQEQAEEAMKEAQEARDEADAARQQAAQQPKVVHVDHIHEPEDDLKVFYYQHIVDENGNEMDIAYVERNGVRGYYADIDADGKADYFLPENATSAEQIINVHDYGENINMRMMAQNANYTFATYEPSIQDDTFGGGGAAVTTGFSGPTPDNDDVIIANYGGDGPDYVNNANVENMTGTVTNGGATFLGNESDIDVAMIDEGGDVNSTYPVLSGQGEMMPEDIGIDIVEEPNDLDMAQNGNSYDDIDAANNEDYTETPYDDIDQTGSYDTASTESYDDQQPDSYIEQAHQDPYLADTHIDSGIEDTTIDGTIA